MFDSSSQRLTRHSRLDPESRPGGIAYKPPSNPNRVIPGLTRNPVSSIYGSRIKVTSQARWRPGWRMFGSSGQGLALHSRLGM